MKIIRVSNFNIETEAEYVVAEGIKHQVFADTILKALIDNHSSDQSFDYFRIVPDDHKLWRGMADIVGD